MFFYGEVMPKTAYIPFIVAFLSASAQGTTNSNLKFPSDYPERINALEQQVNSLQRENASLREHMNDLKLRLEVQEYYTWKRLKETTYENLL